MEEEILLLVQQLSADPEKAIAKIRSKSKDIEKIKEFQKEYKDHDREIRDTQVGKIQKDKTIGTEGKTRTVKAVRTPINFARKIVNTATSFEVGKPVSLIPSENNTLSKLITQLWKVNRIDSLIQKLISLKKAETQAALQFYISDLKPTSVLNKILVKIGLKSQAKEIKAKLLDNKSGRMTPYFNSIGDMILFMWEYESKDSSDKTIKNVQIWDEKSFHYLNDSSGTMAYVEPPKPHGFDRIPVVYTDQEEPEWFVVKELIDRLETSLSKLGASNDYTAYPLLQIFGEVQSFPEKDESGKVMVFPITIDEESGKPIHGNAEFLTAESAVESNRLELESLESFIYSISQTPNVSFDNLKGISGVSGIAIKLMFIDAVIKASSNEGENRTMIERIINILTSGVVNTTNTALLKESTTLYFDVIFNSILPTDIQEIVTMATGAISSNIMSKKTGVALLSITSDNEEELKQIELENKATTTQNNTTSV